MIKKNQIRYGLIDFYQTILKLLNFYKANNLYKMSVYGTLASYKILSLEEDLRTDDAIKSDYLKIKHQKATELDNYIIQMKIQDPRYNEETHIKVSLPKLLVDNNLLEIGSYVECHGASCMLTIIGVENINFTRI